MIPAALFRSLTLALLALALTQIAAAGAITFADRTAWQAAVSGAIHIDFESVPIDNPPGFNFNATSMTIGGVVFTGSGTPTGIGTPGVYLVPAAYAPALYDWGSGTSIHFQYVDEATIRATFAAPVTAAAFDLFTYSPAVNSGFLVRLSTGETFQETSGDQPNRGFFGMVTDAPVQWLELSAPSGSQFIGMDNLAFANPTAVPEPSSWVGLGSALVFLCLWRRKR